MTRQRSHRAIQGPPETQNCGHQVDSPGSAHLLRLAGRGSRYDLHRHDHHLMNVRKPPQAPQKGLSLPLRAGIGRNPYDAPVIAQGHSEDTESRPSVQLARLDQHHRGQESNSDTKSVNVDGFQQTEPTEPRHISTSGRISNPIFPLGRDKARPAEQAAPIRGAVAIQQPHAMGSDLAPW